MKASGPGFVLCPVCALLVVVLAACTPSVKGEYACKDGFIDTIKLESDGRALVSATMLGMKQEKVGTYTVNGDNVVITIDRDSNTFTRNGKTLNGGPLVGICTAQ